MHNCKHWLFLWCFVFVFLYLFLWVEHNQHHYNKNIWYQIITGNKFDFLSLQVINIKPTNTEISIKLNWCAPVNNLLSVPFEGYSRHMYIYLYISNHDYIKYNIRYYKQPHFGRIIFTLYFFQSNPNCANNGSSGTSNSASTKFWNCTK